MKSFREFIIEKSEADPISRKDAEKLQRMSRPETSSSSAERIRRGLESSQERKIRKTRKTPSALTQGQVAGAWKAGGAGKPSVVATSSKPEGGTWFGSSKKAIETGQETLRQQVRDTLAKNRGGSAELQAAQSSGPKETMVGKGAKSGTGETYRANRPSETQATGVSPKKGRVSGSVSKGNIKFSGDAKYKEMLAKMPSAKPKPAKPVSTTKVVKQADVSKNIAQQTSDYKTERGERAYRKTGADIEARRSFPTGKGGLKADERNPYVKREVRQARAAKLGGNVWDQPKGTNRPFKDILKIRPSRDVKIDIITKMKAAQQKKQGYPDIDWKATTKPKQSKPIGAPDRSSVRQAIRDLRASKSKPSTPSTPSKPQASKSYSEIPSKFQVSKKDRPTQRPVNATTHGVDSQGNYLSKAERKRIHSGKAGAVVKYQPPKAEVTPTPSKPKELTAKDVGKQVSKSISKSQARSRVGAGGVLSALGAAQEYKVGSARAKAEGKGKLGQLFRGAMRAGGAFLGGTGGTALGGAVTKSGIGAAAAGAYGYAKGAEAGSSLAKKVEKSKAGKWLASKAKQYVPGLK